MIARIARLSIDMPGADGDGDWSMYFSEKNHFFCVAIVTHNFISYPLCCFSEIERM